MCILEKIERKFCEELRKMFPLIQPELFLLAVSGGRDSMVMAHLFLKNNIKFAMAHCNFHLRGDSSNHDMQFVQKWAQENEIQLFVKEFDTYELLERSNLSLEMLARELRYNWFETLKADYPFIATAHHAQDNVETVFLNLARGTGYKGLNGIAAVREGYIRPLLQFSSDEIHQYVLENHIVYCVDASNYETVFYRNKIRNVILPLFKELNPQFLNVMQRNIEIFNEQYQLYEALVREKQALFLTQKSESWYIDIEQLLQTGVAEPLLNETLKTYGYNAAQIKDVFCSLKHLESKIFYSENYVLLKDRGQLIIQKNDPQMHEDEVLIHSLEEFKKFPFSIEEYVGNSISGIEISSRDFLIDKSLLNFPIRIITWKEGDSFYPFGMEQKKKLSDFFVNQKINIIEKKRIKLLCIDQKIAWIIGHRADNRFKITNKTESFYIITYNEE